MTERSGSTTVIDIARILRRRKWIILAAVVVVPAVAVAHAVRQPSYYASSAQVLLSRTNPAATFAGVNDPSAQEDPVRYGTTQAFLARSPQVLSAALRKAAIPGVTLAAFEHLSSVTSSSTADILVFYVRNRVPAHAQQLANAYARQYVVFRRSHDTSTIRSALAAVTAQVGQLSAKELQSGAGQALLTHQQELQTLADLEGQNTFVARAAQPAYKISPRPKRDGALGLALGLVLGIGLALLREAFDTRIRTTDEVAERLRLPLLGRLPAPPVELQEGRGLVMVDQPYTVAGEMFRMLRTNLDMANVEHTARSILITSASESEGKTTTACNLAVAFAIAGRSVAIVDLDLRRPAINRYFGLKGGRGLSDVAVGATSLDDALVYLDPPDWQEGDPQIAVLGSGPLPPNPAEFATSASVAATLDELRARFDLVLIDSPPLLRAAETTTLSTKADALVVVVRLNAVTRGMLTELHNLLGATPALKLGFVAAGGDEVAPYGLDHYGGGYAYPDRDLVG